MVYFRELEPLTVGVSGYVLQYPYRGVGRYARRVLEQLRAAPAVRPLLISGEWADRAAEQLGAIDGYSSGSLRAVRVPDPLGRLLGHVPPKAYEIVQRMYWEQLGVQIVSRRVGFDVLYSPYHALPLFPPRRSIVTIHDLIPLSEPGYRGGALAHAYFRLACLAAGQAAAVITDSGSAKREIVRLLRIPEGRIHVVPLGVEPIFTSRWDQEGMERARVRLGLPERYMLYVGGSDLRKNIGVLLRAMRILREEQVAGTVPTLVIAANAADAGSTPWHPDWRAQADDLVLSAEVRFVDRIAEEDLPAVYRGAEAFLFPSRAEGFGLTPLEALACGAPVLCAEASSLPEVVGDAALLLPPDDPGAWAAAILRICTDEGLRERLHEAGPRHAAPFTWERTGAGVLEVIRRVAGRGGPL